MTKVHAVIPDCQVREGVSLEHLDWAGRYISEKKPDTIVCLGDFADMPSLSSWDVGKKSFEGRSYISDVQATKNAMNTLIEPIETESSRVKSNKKKQWNPRKVMTLGNHEDRINRAIESDRKLEGLISVDDLGYKEHGWEVYPFLDVVQIDGICYSHYFTSGSMGRPVTSARALTTKKHQSCIMGHVQTTEIDMSSFRADGTPIISIFAGCFYQHHEGYLGPQGNVHHRGMWMLYEVEDGAFWPHFISIDYLRRKYGVV